MENVVTRVIRSKMQTFLAGSCNFTWLLVVTYWLLVNAAFDEKPN